MPVARPRWRDAGLFTDPAVHLGTCSLGYPTRDEGHVKDSMRAARRRYLKRVAAGKPQLVIPTPVLKELTHNSDSQPRGGERDWFDFGRLGRLVSIDR